MAGDHPNPHRPYRIATAVVLGAAVIWLFAGILGSIGAAVFGGTTTPTLHVRRVPYEVGGDNWQSYSRCASALRRHYVELRERISTLAAGELGPRARRRWRQWMAHFKERLQQERARCHLDGQAPDPDDPVLQEMTDLAEALEELTEHVGRSHMQLERAFGEEVVGIEGILARVEARLKAARR